MNGKIITKVIDLIKSWPLFMQFTIAVIISCMLFVLVFYDRTEVTIITNSNVTYITPANPDEQLG